MEFIIFLTNGSPNPEWSYDTYAKSKLKVEQTRMETNGGWTTKIDQSWKRTKEG